MHNEIKLNFSFCSVKNIVSMSHQKSLTVPFYLNAIHSIAIVDTTESFYQTDASSGPVQSFIFSARKLRISSSNWLKVSLLSLSVTDIQHLYLFIHLHIHNSAYKHSYFFFWKDQPYNNLAHKQKQKIRKDGFSNSECGTH